MGRILKNKGFNYMTVEELRHELHLDDAYGYEGVVITDGVHNFELKECYHDNGCIEIVIAQISDEYKRLESE